MLLRPTDHRRRRDRWTPRLGKEHRRVFLLNLIHPRYRHGGIVGVSAHPPAQPACMRTLGVFAGVAFALVFAPPDLGLPPTPVPATLLSSGGVSPSRRWRMRCWRDRLVPAGATSRAGSSTTGAARRRGGSPRYSRNEVPTHSAQKIFLWLMATGMVAHRFCESPELGSTCATAYPDPAVCLCCCSPPIPPLAGLAEAEEMINIQRAFLRLF